MDKDALVVLVTCPPDKAQALAETLVEERLAACVNIVPNLKSVYRWKGSVQRDNETLLIAKTTQDRFEALRTSVLKHHPNEVPEVIALPIARGHEPYLKWVVESTQ